MAVTAVCHKLFGTFLKNQLRRKVTELDLPYDTALIADRELPRVHQRAVVRGAHPVKASRVPGVAGGGLGRVTCSQEVIATSMRAAQTSRMPLLLAPLGAVVQSVSQRAAVVDAARVRAERPLGVRSGAFLRMTSSLQTGRPKSASISRC